MMSEQKPRYAIAADNTVLERIDDDEWRELGKYWELAERVRSLEEGNARLRRRNAELCEPDSPPGVGWRDMYRQSAKTNSEQKQRIAELEEELAEAQREQYVPAQSYTQVGEGIQYTHLYDQPGMLRYSTGPKHENQISVTFHLRPGFVICKQAED